MVYLLALGRFFLALGGLDTGSSFGGLGSSREMTISALAEPAMMLAVFTVAIGANSTNLCRNGQGRRRTEWRFLAPSQMLAFAALFIVLIAETGTHPGGQPATHLELTMIHEAMILEYSGPYLALIEWGASIKQLVLMTLLVNSFLPVRPAARTGRWAGVLTSLVYLLLKLLAAGCLPSCWWRPPTPRCGCSGCPTCWRWPSSWERWRWSPRSCSEIAYAHSSKSRVRRQDGHPDGGAGAGAADRHGRRSAGS